MGELMSDKERRVFGPDGPFAEHNRGTALRTETPAASLDVESLAEAIVIAVRAERAPIGYKGDGWPAYWEKDRPATVLVVTSLAKRLAVEYERLMAEGSEPADSAPNLVAHPLDRTAETGQPLAEAKAALRSALSIEADDQEGLT